jgi:RHS repeat-associated protein
VVGRFFLQSSNNSSLQSSVADESGDLVERYEYDVYGAVTIFDGAGITLTASAIGNPYLFTARRYDPESGNYTYRARMYSPWLGRFLSMDPIGFDAGDYNLYRYVFNNPVNATDPTGEFAFVPWLLKASAEAAADALMQALFNYFLDPTVTTFDEAVRSIDLGQVGVAFLTGLLPWSRVSRSFAGAVGDVILYILDAQSDCDEFDPVKMLRIFATSLGAEIIGDYIGDAVAKYGTMAVAKGLRKLGFDELAEKLLRQLNEALGNKLDDFLSKVRPGKSPKVGVITGTFTDAEAYFRSIVRPDTIRPHTKWQGGYLAETVDGLTIGLRPGSKSGGPAIDLHKLEKAGKSDWIKVHFEQ